MYCRMSERPGVLTHSLYKWLRDVKPDNTGQQTQDLLDARTEILRLKAQLMHTDEERDILKKAARYFAREPDWSIALSMITVKSGRSLQCVGFSRLRVPDFMSGSITLYPLEKRITSDCWSSSVIPGRWVAEFRLSQDLREIGDVCSRNQVAKIMRKNRIQAIHGYKVKCHAGPRDDRHWCA